MLCRVSHMTILSEIVCVMNGRNQPCQASVTCLSPVCEWSRKLVDWPENVRSSNSCQLQAFQDNVWANFWKKSPNDSSSSCLNWWSSRQGLDYFGQLLHFLVFHFTVSLNAFLSMSFRVIGPRYSLCLRFCHPSNFSVAPAEIRDSNILLYCSIIVSFGLHSRWVHPKFSWSRNDVGSSISTFFIIFFRMGAIFSFFPAILMSSTYSDRNNPSFRWTNIPSQFGIFSQPSSNKVFSYCGDDRWSHLGLTNSRHGLQRHHWVQSVETRFTMKFSADIFASLRLVPALEEVLGIRSLFLTILLYHLLLGLWILLPFMTLTLLSHWLFEDKFLISDEQSFFVRSILPSCWFFEDEYLMHPTFPNLPGLLSKYLLSKFFIAKKDIPGNMFFVKLMNSRLIFWWSRMIFNHCSKRHYWPFEWFSKSFLARSFPIGQEVLDVSQIATAFHKVWPPPFIQSWLWQSCWSAFLCSSNGSFSDAICLGSMSCWSAVFHHKSSHALPNFIELSVCTTFGLCDGSKNFNKLFPSRVRILFCTDKIESIEWQDLAPRQRTDDCFEIHIHHWELCDPLLLITKLFCTK